jgi:hypothetical protein
MLCRPAAVTSGEFMGSKELVEAALRVLTAWTSGDRTNSSDIEILRQHALPGETEIHIDDLACRIVARECARVIQDSQADRKGTESSAPRRRPK